MALVLLATLAQPSVAGEPGDLDNRFSGNGKRVIDVGFPGGAEGLALLDEGKILVAGSRSPDGGGSGESVLARLLRDGSLDPSFGDGGVVVTPLGEFLRDVAVQPGGRIVAAGTPDVTVVRFLPDGKIDPSFGTSGVVHLTIEDTEAEAVAIQPDGGIVVAGGDRDFNVIRLLADGALDPAFDTDGIATVDVRPIDFARDLVLQPDGGIVVGGFTPGPRFETASWTVVRLTPDGFPDPSFSRNGMMRVVGYGWTDLYGLALQPNGRILLTGDIQLCLSVGRLLPSGRLDRSFGDEGIVWSGICDGDHPTSGDAIAVQEDGEIVVSGWGSHFAEHGSFIGARFRRHGRLDPTFGAGGAVWTVFPPEGDGGAGPVVIQRNGKILVAGGAGGRFALARYLP